MTALLKTALIYDFDGTLARGNLQERSYIPEALGMTAEDFWNKHVKPKTRSDDADEILIYMHLMLKLAKAKVTREALCKHGEAADLFDGLSDGSWFTRINDFAERSGLAVEHYVISSGIKEMIEGCPIAGKFEHIFASKFIYDESGHAIGPAVGINYTNKTQFLFRINKGIDNTWDNDRLNAYTPENGRPIPFKRMVFFGDGETDIPTMKMMHAQGGHSIAVYDPQRDKKSLQKIHKLISDDRVNFVAAGDYRPGSELDIIVKGILGRIARTEGLTPAEE